MPLLILCLAASSMAADSDQEKRIAKILHPDRTLTYYSGEHTVGGVKSFGTSSAKTSSSFNISQKFHPTGYTSKGFNGGKSDWKGDAKFETKAARTEGTRKMLDADKKARTKTASTKDASEGSKVASIHDSQYAKREFLGPESKKVHENTPITKATGWKGDLQPMTIDDVRDLLNKPKL
jgi:hypothetical protein